MVTSLALSLCLMTANPAMAQIDSTTVHYYVGKAVRAHPDGAVGAASFHGSLQYQFVTKPPNVPVVDIQKFNASLGWVAHPSVNFMGSFRGISEDSSRYGLAFGLRLYTVNPERKDKAHNPDGPVGGPVLTASGGIRYSDLAVEDAKTVGDFTLLVPVSRRLSILAGMRLFEAIEQADVQQAYGGFNFYLSPYNADSAYTNPDGQVGNAAFHLSGGGSENGVFGDLTMFFPISNKLTWHITLRGERVELPYRRVVAIGGGFSLYPSN
ncbi:MAG: hypothetical protein AB1483_09525 [Candidatus Zixiibacteriota bacterium]